MIIISQLIAAAKRINTIMKMDNKDGHQWRYYNTKRSENTFEKTRKAGKYYTNCMGGVVFAGKEAGLPGEAFDWYGAPGKIVWLSEDAKRNAKKYFNIISVKTKTVKQCIADGTMQPVDIVTYMSLGHTNMFLGNNRSFDSGHAFCNGSGEGAPYEKWIGTTPYKGYKVNCLFRLKKPSVYRVQVGKYKFLDNALKKMATVKERTGFDCFYEQSGKMYYVYCGSFEQEENANARAKLLKEAGFEDVFVTGA